MLSRSLIFAALAALVITGCATLRAACSDIGPGQDQGAGGSSSSSAAGVGGGGTGGGAPDPILSPTLPLPPPRARQ